LLTDPRVPATGYADTYIEHLVVDATKDPDLAVLRSEALELLEGVPGLKARVGGLGRLQMLLLALGWRGVEAARPVGL
jgi:hypothetical protein